MCSQSQVTDTDCYFYLCALLFQTLVDAPCPELASVLGFQEKKAESLQETLQRVLDRREEERQSKELLQLYIKAVEREDKQEMEPSEPSQEGRAALLIMYIVKIVSFKTFFKKRFKKRPGICYR